MDKEISNLKEFFNDSPRNVHTDGSLSGLTAAAAAAASIQAYLPRQLSIECHRSSEREK